ncbi:MAG TPA: tetratricopeptide repeat protein [Myxococcota bacterium]
MRRLRRARAALLLALSPLAVAGCSTLGGARRAQPEVVVRPEAPADYDYLVGRQLELEGRLDESLAAYQRALAKDPGSALLHRKVAEMLARAGRPDEAVPYAEQALARAPEDTDLRVFLGTLHRLRRDVEAAEAVLRKPDGTPIDTDAALLLYGLYADSGRDEDALRVARWMVRADPTNLRSYFALARAYEKLDRHAEAEQALRRALEQHPGSLAVYSALARGRRQRGDREGEIAIYREVLRVQPRHHATLVALADAYMGLERWDDARRTLEEIERAYPDDLRSIVRLGYLDLEQNDYEAAAARFEKALADNPEQHEVHYLLGLVQRRAGRLAEAQASFERVPPEHERWSDARLQIAALKERQEDYRGALDEAEAVRARAPSRQLDLYVASLRAKSGDFDGAVAFLQGLLEESPGDEELLYNLGVVHGEAGQRDEALAYMRRVLAVNPDHPGALNYLGYSLAERGEQLDEAERMITRAIEQRPDDGYITDSLGWVYYMRARQMLDAGRVEEGRALLERAIRELERAAQLTGGDPVISEHLGDAYLLLEDRVRALRFYEEAVHLDPRESEQPNLREKLEQLRRELAPR